MNYKVSISNPADHFVHVAGAMRVPGNTSVELQLPAWRPGRYELGNFAKNVRGFRVEYENGDAVNFNKVTKDRWRLMPDREGIVTFQYEYYANQPDAGACFVEADFLYLNPVHCFMYVPGREDETFSIELNIPDEWQIACQLKIDGKVLHAPDFDMLADSPFFAGPNLHHHACPFGESTIHFWFQGGCPTSWDRIQKDTLAYATAQQRIFGDFPPHNYHFMYLLLPTKFRHGVEHLDSTVIALGPATELEEEAFYNDLLAISCHELFHLWNVKRMRPSDFFPYDFTRENYSTLGYVYEGVTTYYGDLMLLRSGVWNFETYAASLEAHLAKHLNNPGRNHYSVAASSFDTWLDGYVPGVKGRKVSIYTEGHLAAMVADVLLLRESGGSKRLDDALHLMYQQSWKQGKGYTEQTYRMALEEAGNCSFERYFNEMINGCGNWDNWIHEVLEIIGLRLTESLDDAGIVQPRIVKISNPSAGQLRFFEIWGKSS